MLLNCECCDLDCELCRWVNLVRSQYHKARMRRGKEGRDATVAFQLKRCRQKFMPKFANLLPKMIMRIFSNGIELVVVDMNQQLERIFGYITLAIRWQRHSQPAIFPQASSIGTWSKSKSKDN